MLEIIYDRKGGVRLEYLIPTRGLIGFRNTLLTLTAGTGLMGSIGMGYRPFLGEFREQRNGALTASSPGKSLAFGLADDHALVDLLTRLDEGRASLLGAGQPEGHRLTGGRGAHGVRWVRK